MARLHIKPRPAEEVSDRAINLLLAFGRQRAAIIDRLEDAARAEDWAAVNDLARALVHTADEAGTV